MGKVVWKKLARMAKYKLFRSNNTIDKTMTKRVSFKLSSAHQRQSNIKAWDEYLACWGKFAKSLIFYDLTKIKAAEEILIIKIYFYCKLLILSLKQPKWLLIFKVRILILAQVAFMKLFKNGDLDFCDSNSES